MNDQQQPYDPYGPYDPQPRIVGYDAYGQPVYQQAQQSQQLPQQQQQSYEQQQHQQQQQYDAYGQPQQQAYGYDYGHDPYAQQPGGQQGGQGYGSYDAYGYATDQQQPYGTYDPSGVQQPAQQWDIPQQNQTRTQTQPHEERQRQPLAPETATEPEAGRASAVPGQRRAEADPAERQDAPAGTDSVHGADSAHGAGRAGTAGDTADKDYRTEQFSFIEEPNEESEDVIDWLKFTESRSERREEAKRRGRSRVVALTVALALALGGGVGYLWYAGMLPGTSGGDRTASAASGPEKRDVIVVHLHDTEGKGTSTALLVNNATTGQGTTLLLPNSLSVADEEGAPTTLAQSVENDGSDGTRESIGSLLGTEITGTWRLDTPYLENLVEMVGSIEVTTDTEVPAAKKGEDPLVEKGENETLNGRMAVAYATYRAGEEPETKQLQRFGQVIQGVLRKMSDDPEAATVTIETLAMILDPSLPERDLGASLANLAEHAKVGDYRTSVLPVQPTGTLSDKTAETVVKDVLGGSVKAPEPGAAVRVGVRNASGAQDAAESARISLVNAGYAFVDAGTDDAAPTSRVSYGDAAKKSQAEEVAKTLGLPTSAVRQDKAVPNADVSVVLGQDYEVD
ncbi:LCP family protein [Streptomyces sp. NPDC004749]